MQNYINKIKESVKDYIKCCIGWFLATHFPALSDRFFTLLNKKSNKLFTFHNRPRLEKDFKLETDITSQGRLAIVIQGALGADGFVCETVKIYKKLFPGSEIIVSSWLGESAVIIGELENIGAAVILNEKPINRGISNINMQIVSSRAGIEFAKKNGAEYVLKTRSDQRLYATNVYEYFRNLLSIFPPYAESVDYRIIGVSLNTFIYRMYGLSDMLMFGYVNDILKFWSVRLDDRDPDSSFDARAATLREFAEWKVCEVYLTTEYLKSVGHTPQWTLDDSWDAFRKYFCIIDKESIDLYWDKYTTLEYRWLRYHLPINAFREITFRDWLRLYKNDINSNADESILNQRISDWVLNNE